MDLSKLQAHVDTRFDKLENKLDDYAIQTVKNTSDLTWLKTSGSVILTILILPTLAYIIASYFSK